MRVSPDEQPLYTELRALIASSRQRLAGTVNAELTRLYWSVGERLRTEVLGGADRAKYGDQLINRVGVSWRKNLAVGLKPKICTAWCSLPRLSRCPRLSRHCHDN
ncbi:DUF1016 N-terminal domain-containing protein [Polaromonas sp. P1-6]|nr:DUF1016 N-terminal domain-containing protein [Polaromonas sp. P1-6]